MLHDPTNPTHAMVINHQNNDVIEQNQNHNIFPQLRNGIFGDRLQLLLMIFFLMLVGLVIKFWASAISEMNPALLAVSSIMSFALLMIMVYFAVMICSNRNPAEIQNIQQYGAILQQQRRNQELQAQRHATDIATLPRTSAEYIEILNEEVTERVISSLKCSKYEPSPRFTHDEVGILMDGIVLEDGNEPEKSSGSTCSICLAEYEVSEMLVELPCKHQFHRPCVKEWFKRKNTCPLCKCRIF